MIALLVIAVWILLLALVAGLCAAARGGDLAQRFTDAPAAAGWQSAHAPAWGQADQLVISARAEAAGSRAELQPDAPLTHSRGVAA